MPRSGWIAALVVTALAVLAYLPGLGRQEFVGTEDFRARIAGEMLDGGSWLLPTYYGRPILTKPPLYYWTLAGTFALTGERGPASARLPSLAALAAAAALLAAGAAAAAGTRAGILAGGAWLLAANSLKNGANAEIDPLFHCFTLAALLCWWRSGAGAGGWPWAAAAGLAGGLAAMAKGAAVLPFVLGAAVATAWLGQRPRPARLAAALLPLATLGLWWPLWLRWGAAGRLTGAISEGLQPALAWDASLLYETLLYPLYLVGAGLPFTLPAFHRLRAPGRAGLDRYAVSAALASFALLLLTATKGTRYLLPCLSLLVLAGALRLELLARSGAFVRAAAGCLLLAAAGVTPFLTPTLTLGGALSLSAVAASAAGAFLIAPRRPAAALMLLVVPARALLPQVYVPAWEARGESSAAAVAGLQELCSGARTLGVAALETPRLIDPLGLEVAYFDRIKDLRAAAAQGQGWDAVLFPSKERDREIPGYVLAGTVQAPDQELEIWKPR